MTFEERWEVGNSLKLIYITRLFSVRAVFNIGNTLIDFRELYGTRQGHLSGSGRKLVCEFERIFLPLFLSHDNVRLRESEKRAP